MAVWPIAPVRIKSSFADCTSCNHNRADGFGYELRVAAQPTNHELQVPLHMSGELGSGPLTHFLRLMLEWFDFLSTKLFRWICGPRLFAHLQSMQIEVCSAPTVVYPKVPTAKVSPMLLVPYLFKLSPEWYIQPWKCPGSRGDAGRAALDVFRGARLLGAGYNVRPLSLRLRSSYPGSRGASILWKCARATAHMFPSQSMECIGRGCNLRSLAAWLQALVRPLRK